MFESPAASECMVFDLPRSVTLVDHAGNVVWANPQSAQLRPLPADLLVRLHGRKPVRLEYDGVVVELLPTATGTLVVAERHRALAVLAELMIQRLVFEADRAAGLARTLRATARIAIQLSGWRWMGVSRYLDPRGAQVELRAFFDGERRLGGPMRYATADTPCGAVVSGEGVVHLADLARRFPGDADLQRLGAREYVGTPYRCGGVAVGHVFLMTDHDCGLAQREEAAMVLRLAASFIGPRLSQLAAASEDAGVRPR